MTLPCAANVGSLFEKPLFILEMANNHMGDVAHGVNLIRAFADVCKDFPFQFAFKLQYRDLDTFIHPSMRGRDDLKYIKRFSETRLSRQQFDTLVAEIRANGFLCLSTPFDEASVDVIQAQALDAIKIASCSMGDWPLLERVVRTEQPLIVSTAGSTLEELDRLVSFLAHRQKSFAILHCVGEYPTPDANMHLSQVDFLRRRYPGVRVGFSTHENPDNTDIVKIALGKGARIFEKHVGLPTDQYPLNAYSASPQQIRRWLEAAQYALLLCGEGEQRLPVNENERASLRALRRGVFARRPITAGEVVQAEDVYFAFPPQDGQFTANDWSKYATFTAQTDIPEHAALSPENSALHDVRDKVWTIVQRVRAQLADSHVVVPGRVDLEISHHYGLDRFDETGLAMLTVVNRGYCKKLLMLLPGQRHPEQYHKRKEETFHVLQGELTLQLDGVGRICRPGDVVTVEPGVRHAFHSQEGAIIEELSSTHLSDDSFYTDETINANRDRKTLLSYWMD
ncbi:N-acetylneuraminate synthase family protein [Pseudomonas fulva]|uniref:N-acetylneuraminate synthase family protein n=1 Tax=Pseudomonas fulva TaxID=47880 RepID=UPI0018A8D548|nr:N-acetylneuraminate synthase family protein [Pseudomonas fulva]MBF8673911.1 N-acetylneuraminate synthase family protein [Pseudomonas fulva]MBF8697526.1 N-acetylneuraminate synthase family protein [Pseudomonas fulva]